MAAHSPTPYGVPHTQCVCTHTLVHQELRTPVLREPAGQNHLISVAYVHPAYHGHPRVAGQYSCRHMHSQPKFSLRGCNLVAPALLHSLTCTRFCLLQNSSWLYLHTCLQQNHPPPCCCIRTARHGSEACGPTAL